MIDYLITHLKLKNRIYFGYLLTGIIAFFIIVISYLTFFKVTDSFKHFVALNKQSHIEFLVTKNITDIQRHALIYTYQGHQSAAAQVETIYQDILVQLNKNTRTSDAKADQILITTQKHLKNYYSAFQQVIKQREIQLHLINIDFRQHANTVETTIKTLLNEQNNLDISLDIYKILNSFLVVEKNAIHYFDSLDSSYVKNAKKNIINIKQNIQLLQQKITNPEQQFYVKQTIILLDLFEAVFLEAVQRTRGYLYLVNVVMAAEAYEIIYQSHQLNTLLSVQLNKIESKILNNISNAVLILLFIALLFIVFSLIFSYTIGSSITRPIEQLTQTFNSLAHGSKEIPIKNYSLMDEIGKLTSAAKVFRDKNSETEQLLHHSKKITDELEANKQQLTRSNNELEQFVYTVSHDLKSPLVTSMGFIGIIRKLSQQGKYQQAIEKLEKVVNANERMSQLINDLLELSRVGRINLEKENINLNQLLLTFTYNQKEPLSNKHIGFNINPNLPTIYANESRLLQLFENMLSNALKYAMTPEGLTIEIGSKETSDTYLIYFRDNGPGIEKEFHKKIFGLFYRLETNQEGTGIGLAIAKRVMDFHQGSIWVESEHTSGTTFWMQFPKPTQKDNNHVI